MPKLISAETEAKIRTFSKLSKSNSEIQKDLKDEQIIISTRTIGRIINNIGIARQAILLGQKKPKYRRPPVKRTQGVIQKIASMVKKENPESYANIERETGLSPPTIHKVIHTDLGLNKRYKTRVHRLLPRHRQNRKTNCRKLYEHHLAGDRAEYAVTLDEALVYLKNVNGKRKICFVKKGEKVPQSWTFERDRSYSKGFMVIGILTGRGTVPLFRVPSECKINTEYYIEYVLKPLFMEYLPALYKNEMHKVFFHHDKASSHTSDETMKFLKKMSDELGISYLEKKAIPVKSPDASPLDFFGFGYLKQRLYLRKATTLDGVWKIAQGVWSEITVSQIKRVFDSWKRRLRMISKMNGQQIENTLNLHLKRLNINK